MVCMLCMVYGLLLLNMADIYMDCFLCGRQWSEQLQLLSILFI